MGSFLEQVIQAPQRSPPVLDNTGQFALYQEHAYSLSTHEAGNAAIVLDVHSGETSELPSESQNFIWMEPGREVLWQKKGEKNTELWVSDAMNPSTKYQAGSFTTDAVLFQAVQLQNGDLGVLLYASKIDGPSEAWPRSTGRVFTSLPCLTFDQGIGRPRYDLLFLRIPQTPPGHPGRGARYALSDDEPIDVLSASKLEFFPYSGSMPNISTPNCALSSSGIAFVAQDSIDRPTDRFTSDVYFIPLPAESEGALRPPVHLPTGACNGWAALPVFSQDGRRLAFVRDERDTAILISRQIFVVHDVLSSTTPKPLRLIDESGGESPLYPEWVRWGSDAKKLYFLTCDTGRARLFSVDATSDVSLPMRVAPTAGRTGSVLAASFKGDQSGAGRALLVETSLTSPNRMFILDLGTRDLKEVPNQQIPDFGLRSEQVSELWIPNGGRQIHTFVMRPSNFRPDKKYPVAMFTHGGPIASWLDAFHLYWTLPLFAERGYVLVMPNFIGSTGYSRKFREAAYGNFAEGPYRDLEACMDHVGRSIPYADVSRAVSIGGSYGAYMNYWIAGRPLGKRFKALVAHAGGGFGSVSFYASDFADLYPRLLTGAGENHDVTDVERTMFRSDPAQFAKDWSTPMLFTHGEKDNRCPLFNSLAAFAHCQNLGIDSKLVVFSDESHFISKPENNYHWHKEIFDFIDEHTNNHGNDL